MDLAGYVINAVLFEGRSLKEVCAAHDVSRSWLYELIARYRERGDNGLQPYSKPRSTDVVRERQSRRRWSVVCAVLGAWSVGQARRGALNEVSCSVGMSARGVRLRCAGRCGAATRARAARYAVRPIAGGCRRG
jgi:hypothetical protein